MDRLERQDENAVSEKDVGKQPYETPRLDVYGDLRSVTLGGTPGAGESQGASLRKFKL